ncbi:MAG: ABC transporter permease, partial [Clostridia bacterium]|nr:ABC transporter permease [Clostridia bacterium]
TLIAVVITFSFLITLLVGIVKDATIPFRSRYDADYVVLAQENMEESNFDLIKGTALNVQGVDGVGWFNSSDYNPVGDEDTDITIYGVGDQWALEHCTTGLDSGVEERWKNADKPIVLNQNVAMLLGVEIGDKVSFTPEHEDFKAETHEFTVVGIDKSVSQWDMVAYCDYKVNYRMTQKATFLVSATEVNAETFVDLRDAIEGLNLSMTFALTFDEWAYAEQENFAGVGPLMTLLQILVWVISIMGVGNIAIVTVFDRRAEFRLYKLSGMSSGDYLKFALGEGIVTAISGGLLGFIAGYAVNMLVPSLGSIIQRYSSFNVMPWQLLVTFAIGVGAFMILWMIIALVNRNIKTGSINERNLNR